MRRAAILAAAGITTLVLIAVVLWAMLPWLLETVGARWIGGSLGIPPPRFTVAALSSSRLELHDLRIGDAAGGVRADSVVVTFDLVHRHLGTLLIEGARIQAAWRDGTLFIEGIGPLSSLFDPQGAGGGAPPRLPVEVLRISAARMELRSPLGLIEATLDATANQNGEDLNAEGNLSATAPGVAGEAAFALRGGPEQQAPWIGIGGHAQVDLTARDAALPGLAQGIDGYANVAIDAQPGGIRVSSADGLAFTVRTLEPAALAQLPEGLRAESEAGLTAVLGGLVDQPFSAVLAPHGEGLRVSGSGAASVRLGAVTGRLSGDGTTTWSRDGTLLDLAFSRAEMIANGVPAFGGRLHGSLLGRDIAGHPEGLTMQAEVYVLGDDVAMGDLATPRLRLRAAGPVAWEGAIVRAGLVSAHVGLEGPARVPGAELPKGLDWQVTAPNGEGAGDALVLDRTTGAAVLRAHLAVPQPALVLHAGGRTIDARFASAELDAAVPLEDGPPRAVTVTLRGGAVHSGDLQAAAIEATLREAAEGLAVEADAQVPLLPGEAAPLPEDTQAHRPLRLHLSASRAPGEALRFTARVREGGLSTILTAKGRHDLDSGVGQASVQVPRLTFGNDLQPEHLYAPLSAAALRVEGDVAAQGTVRWTRTAVDPRLEVLLDGLTVRRGFIVMRRMHGVVTLNRLWPPRTPADQVLAIAAIDAGVPFTNAELTYRLDGKGNAVIKGARMSLADGTIHADPFTMPFDAEAARTVLHMTGVRLDPLVALADLGGLAATGTLSGEVPVELRQGNVLFHDGTLQAQEPGTIRYRPDEPPSALSAGGAGVDLMLQALHDFHYKSLRLSLSGSAGGDLELGLHLAGANPALYDGYPLEFNLTLSGALAQIIEGSLTGYQVPDRIRRQLERFGVEP